MIDDPYIIFFLFIFLLEKSLFLRKFWSLKHETRAKWTGICIMNKYHVCCVWTIFLTSTGLKLRVEKYREIRSGQLISRRQRNLLYDRLWGLPKMKSDLYLSRLVHTNSIVASNNDSCLWDWKLRIFVPLIRPLKNLRAWSCSAASLCVAEFLARVSQLDSSPCSPSLMTQTS